jgi:hypothetical protein
MHDLVDFLVEEKYCNTGSEAIKILESVSEEFYEYLIEAQISAMDLTTKAKKQLRQELSRPNPQQKRIVHFTKKLKGLSGPAAAEASQMSMTSKGLQKTPPGKGGTRAQKPRDVVSTVGTTSGVSRTDLGQLSRAATMATGISPESRGIKSVDTARTKTSELVGDRYSDRAVAGGRGTQQARSGGTRGARTR